MCAERGIQANQHAFVNYVEMSESVAAHYLNARTDHPDAHWWMEPMDLPDHSDYSRPHPQWVERFYAIADLQASVIIDTFEAVKRGQYLFSKPGLSQIHDATNKEIEGLLNNQDIPRSWRPDESFSPPLSWDTPPEL